jgi:hypothetical protein
MGYLSYSDPAMHDGRSRHFHQTTIRSECFCFKVDMAAVNPNPTHPTVAHIGEHG